MTAVLLVLAGIAVCCGILAILKAWHRPTPGSWLVAYDGSLINLASARFTAVVDTRDTAGNVIATRVVVGWSSTPALDTNTVTVIHQGRRPECEKVQTALGRQLHALRI